MVALPLSDRRLASTMPMAVNFLGTLERARSTRRDAIDPSIRSRSMDPGLALWGLPSYEGVSIITGGTILLLFLLIVMSVRTMVSTRAFSRRRAAHLRDMEEPPVYICHARPQRVRATLNIGLGLGDSSVDLIDLCPHPPPIDTEPPPSYHAAASSPFAQPDCDPYVSRSSAAFAASYDGRQHVRPRSKSNGYIHITVLVAVPNDTSNGSLSGLSGLLGDLTDSEPSVTDVEDAAMYSDAEDEWGGRVLLPQPLSPSSEEAYRHPHPVFARAHTWASATAQAER